ncbi:hypothetical protein ACMU_10245 [Actibacterium mucosum KCTC 23349]|uniref:Thiol:disulfide interchange protein DsbD N-terminal domain-containing protein n=1 Tax=Actibacterium mucosum KCTC 23349 TaxID=1454373 RepID=A0A037ZMR7_9RHOB|nr:hypothetical protein ACMU_10245 [Actibacterium mucosum KCTC 23349]
MKTALAATALAAAALVMPAQAQNGHGFDNVVSAQLLPGWVQPDGSVMAGLRLTLEPGWKTYWRAPGDAGIPPQFDFSGSDNLRAMRVFWPRPEVQDQNGMRTLGYSDVVVLPITFVPRNSGQPLRLRGALELGVCQDVCVPVSLQVAGQLPGQGGESSIRAALSARPETARSAGVGRVVCEARPISDGMHLTARIPIGQLGQGEIAVFELNDPSVWISEARVTREGNVLVAEAEMVPPTAAPFAIDRSQVRITVLTDNRAVDIKGCVGG